MKYKKRLLFLIIIIAVYLIVQFIRTQFILDDVGWFIKSKEIGNAYRENFSDSVYETLKFNYALINKKNDTISIFKTDKNQQLLVFKILPYTSFEMEKVYIRRTDEDYPKMKGASISTSTSNSPTIEISRIASFKELDNSIKIEIATDSLVQLESKINFICYKAKFRNICISGSDNDFDLIFSANSRFDPKLSINCEFAIQNYNDQFHFYILFPSNNMHNDLSAMILH